jgi:hypothetical protein
MRGRTRKSCEARPAGRVERGGVHDGQEKEIELLDHEAEGDDRHAGAHPGEERPLVRGVIGIALDHDAPPCSPASEPDEALAHGFQRGGEGT